MKTCLVVDDSSVIRKVARRILEDLSFTILEAEDGQQALEKCQETMPDAILLDWNMPVMSGMEFLTAFNDLDYGFDERPRVVFCTTENSIDHIRAAIEAGADEYVMKPFDGEILQSKLVEVGAIAA